MLSSRLRIVRALGPLLLAALAYAPFGVAADPTSTVSSFTLSSLNRQVQGEARSLKLSANGRGFGRAAAFFGVDSLSNADRQYLTSGVQWRTSAADVPLLKLSALQTQARGGGFGGQTLLRAESRLDLGGRWYMPDIHSEIDQVNDSGDGAALFGGRAARLGFAGDLGAASYTLDVFQADPRFDALGSAIVAGDRGLQLSGQYNLDNTWQISNRLGLHQPVAADRQPRVVQQWVIQRRSRLTDVGSPWRLSAQFGNAAAGHPDHTPIAIELAAETARWRSWRIDSTLGWYDAAMAAPNNLPVAGTLGRITARRSLYIAGLETNLSPSFSLGGSRYQHAGLASRTGFSLGFPGLGDSVNFSIDYLSPGWGPSVGHGDVQMKFNYSQDVAGLLPRLSSVLNGLRLPWQRRY